MDRNSIISIICIIASVAAFKVLSVHSTLPRSDATTQSTSARSTYDPIAEREAARKAQEQNATKPQEQTEQERRDAIVAKRKELGF